jgi:hypothetical protein
LQNAIETREFEWGQRMTGRRIGQGPHELAPELLNWQLRGSAVDAPDAVPELFAEDFANAAYRRTRQGLQGGLPGHGGLRKTLADFIIPRISEPEILGSDRRLGILQDLLPRLDQLRGSQALAAAVVRDEIARQRHLLSLLQKGLAA